MVRKLHGVLGFETVAGGSRSAGPCRFRSAGGSDSTAACCIALPREERLAIYFR
jgi:hypothetical protein